MTYFPSLVLQDVIMSAMAFQITSLMIVCSTVYSGSGQRKHQSSALLAILRGIHHWPVNSSHKGPVTRQMFPFDDVSKPCNPNNDPSASRGALLYLFQRTTQHTYVVIGGPARTNHDFHSRIDEYGYNKIKTVFLWVVGLIILRKFQ